MDYFQAGVGDEKIKTGQQLRVIVSPQTKFKILNSNTKTNVLK